MNIEKLNNQQIFSLHKVLDKLVKEKKEEIRREYVSYQIDGKKGKIKQLTDNYDYLKFYPQVKQEPFSTAEKTKIAEKLQGLGSYRRADYMTKRVVIPSDLHTPRDLARNLDKNDYRGIVVPFIKEEEKGVIIKNAA